MPKGRRGGGHDHRLDAIIDALHNAKRYQGGAASRNASGGGKGGGGKGGDAQDFRPGDWMCTCGKHNFAWRQRACYGCGAKPPGAAMASAPTPKVKEVRETLNQSENSAAEPEDGKNPAEALQRIRKKEELLRKWKAEAGDHEEEAILDARLARLREDRARLQPTEVQVRTAAGTVAKARSALDKAKEKVKAQADHLHAAVLALEKAEQDRDEAELRLAEAERAMATVAANSDAGDDGAMVVGSNAKAAEAWQTVLTEARTRAQLPGVDQAVAASIGDLVGKLQELFTKLPQDVPAPPNSGGSSGATAAPAAAAAPVEGGAAQAAATTAAAATPPQGGGGAANAAAAMAAAAAASATASAAAATPGGGAGGGTEQATPGASQSGHPAPAGSSGAGDDVDMPPRRVAGKRTVDDARAALDRLGKLSKGGSSAAGNGKNGHANTDEEGAQDAAAGTDDKDL